MSLRRDVDRARIDEVLRRLGETFRRPGRLYLVGGTTMVYLGLRRTTMDVDYAVEVAPEDHAALQRAVARLKDELDANLEEASPGDFIPLPPDWRERSPYVGRFGELDVFHFDPRSAALSKIDRGHEEDFADVVALVLNGVCTLGDIEQAWREIRDDPRLPRRQAERIERHLGHVRALLDGWNH